MSDTSSLTQMEMTLDEARETDRLIKRHINTTRYLLLDMRDRKGWQALGYESFKEYGEKALGYEERHIYRLVDAAEIGLQIGTDQLDSQPSESQLRPLKQIDEEFRKAVWEEATRKAEEEHAKLTAQRVQEAVAEWKQRTQEWAEQSTGQRQKINELTEQIDLLKAQPAPEPQVVEKIPDDYEVIKKQVSTVQDELTRVKQEQAKAIQEGIKTKLKSYQDEVDLLENKKRNLEKQAKDYQDYLSSLGSKTKQLEAQNRAIEKLRQALVDYASEIADFELTDNKETLLRWEHLLVMLQNAQAVTQVFVGVKNFIEQI